MNQLRLLLLWPLFMASLTALANDQEPRIDSVSFFKSQISPQSITIKESIQHYSATKDLAHNFGLTGNFYCYILVKIRGVQKGSFFISIDNTSLDSVLIYRFQKDTSKQLLYEGGNLVQYNTNRRYVWHTAPILIEQLEVFYLVAVKSPSQNINLECHILKEENLYRTYQSFDRLIYFYAGLVILISFISIIGAFLFRRSVLLIYTAYILAVAFWILSHYGYLFPSLYPSFPPFNRIVKQIASLSGMLCLLHIITYAFKSEYRKKGLQRVFILVKIITGLLILLYVIGLLTSVDLTALNIAWHVHLLVSAVIIGLVLASLFRSNDTAKMFAIAISFILFAAVFQIVSNAGWIRSRFLNDHGMLIGSLLEMLVLAVGIFFNVWREKTVQEQQLKTTEKERNRALEMFISMQDDERKRIAADLHDSIGPMLAAIKINFLRLSNAKLEGAASDSLVQKTESIIDEAISEMRNIAHRLMPKGLSTKGLIALLSDYFVNLKTVYHLNIHFDHNINVSLNHELQMNLYRIISELSLNTAKHSEAQNLFVTVKTEANQTTVIIKDNGKGFSPAEKDTSALGLKNVKSRVEYLSGKMGLESSDKGTTVEIWIPN